MPRERRQRVAALGLALGSIVAGILAGQPASARSGTSGDAWRFTIAPYIMGASLDGNVVVRGQEAEVDVSRSKVFDHLDWGFMSMFEARKGNWAVGGDLLYVQLDVETDRPPGLFSPTLGIMTVQGARRLSDFADVTFGARWNHLEGHLDLDPPISLEEEKTRDWVDPIVGVLLRTRGDHRWHALLIADVGGFGVSSDLAWQFFPTAGFDISKNVSVEFGWRLLGTDYDTGDGSDRFKYDMLYEGPVVGMSIGFGGGA